MGMRELSLFTGAGGGLLGTKLLGWEHCGYVESDDYCQPISILLLVPWLPRGQLQSVPSANKDVSSANDAARI